MKKHFTRNRLVLYATREIFTRKKAFATIFFIFTVSLLILLNIYLFSYGSHLASIERAANDYHLRILVSLIFQIVSMRVALNKEPISLIQERNTIYISYVQRSSPKIENEHKIRAYRFLYNKRNMRYPLFFFF